MSSHATWSAAPVGLTVISVITTQASMLYSKTRSLVTSLKSQPANRAVGAPATVLATSLPADADPRLRRLHDYWRSAHPTGGGLPGRQHLDPCDIAPLLRWIWMMDVHRDPLRFRYRLLGTEQ